MDVPGLEAVEDPTVGAIQHGGLSLDRPLASQSPLIEAQMLRSGVYMRHVEHRAARAKPSAPR
jgi:hypothetical protein